MDGGPNHGSPYSPIENNELTIVKGADKVRRAIFSDTERDIESHQSCNDLSRDIELEDLDYSSKQVSSYLQNQEQPD